MAATPESKVKQKATKQLRAMGAYYFYPVMGGFGSSGVPDIVGCFKGMFFAIECKAGNNKPTALQTMHMNEISQAGGLTWVVNEDNVSSVQADLIAGWAQWKSHS